MPWTKGLLCTIAVCSACQLKILASPVNRVSVEPLVHIHDHKCLSNISLWTSESEDPQLVQTNISMSTVASMDRAFHVMQMIAHWDGPLAVVIYARNKAEETVLISFAEETLGPFSRIEGKNLRVRVISQCYHLSDTSQVLSFPINLLRWESVSMAGTSLVLYNDVDFIPSYNAHDLLSQTFQMGFIERSATLLLVPCFLASTGTQWPVNPSISRTEEGTLILKVDPLTTLELKLRWWREEINPPGYPEFFHTHGPVNYDRFISLSNPVTSSVEPYHVDYSLWFEPYFVIDKHAWGGIAGPGLFDSRFYYNGGDKLQFSYEVATRGYNFYVQPGVFIVHTATDFICPAEIQPVCNLAERTQTCKKHDRPEHVAYQFVDFMKDLEPWKGFVPSTHSKVCYIAPYDHFQNMPRVQVAASIWTGLEIVARSFKLAARHLRTPKCDTDDTACGDELRTYLEGTSPPGCNLVTPLIGRYCKTRDETLVLTTDLRLLPSTPDKDSSCLKLWVWHGKEQIRHPFMKKWLFSANAILLSAQALRSETLMGSKLLPIMTEIRRSRGDRTIREQIELEIRIGETPVECHEWDS